MLWGGGGETDERNNRIPGEFEEFQKTDLLPIGIFGNKLVLVA